MSRASTARAPAPACGATLRVSRVNDSHEAAADRLAHHALADNAHRPVPPAAPPSAAGRFAPESGVLAARIAAARSEAQDLPTAERTFFAPRFGHRFDGVRIHAGPAAAAAASAARAQAFTLGRDIYFGDGRYRPDSLPGRELLAHELAHTLQDRPNVVARRALDSGFDLPESDPSTSSGPAGADPAVDDLATLVEAGPTQGNRRAHDQLDRLDPAMRPQALAALRTRVPPADRGKVTALAEGVGSMPHRPGAAPNRIPDIRAEEARPAQVVAAADLGPQVPAPTHARVTGAAAARMQQAVRSVGAEAPVDGAPVPPSGLDTASLPAQGQADGAAPTSAAAVAAQTVAATLDARIGELQGVAGVPLQFQQGQQTPAGDPETFSRTLRSQSLATGFAGRAAEQIRAVLTAAAAVPGQSMAALGEARQAISAQAATQSAAIKQGAANARKQIRERAARIRGTIAARRATTDTEVARNILDASGRATRAHDRAAGGLDGRAETERQRIARSYDRALDPMIGVGIEVGGLAQDAAAARAQRFLNMRTGESSLLDGPLEDDRLEANAEAGRKVGEEYDKSFQKSASEQADRLPDSRPEILAKVSEITGQARTGFQQQLDQILLGASAIETGAKARSRQAEAQMRAALDSNATQCEQALDTAEAQQTAALERQANDVQAALDQSVAAALTSFGQGVGQAAQQLAGSLRSFADSVAAMPPPDTDELAAALAASDPSAALTTMGTQVATVVPTLSGMLTEGQQAGGGALAAAAADAAQGFTGSAAAFAGSANSLNQQSATGFRQLGIGNARSATNLATDAEAGFAQAVTSADGAYSQFGDQVEDNFRTGRLQMHDGLWSPETQKKLAKDMHDYGKEAEDHVQPRWKRVLKWVVTIVVIVAVIAVTVLSAGALGPVGVVLLGAALGAAAGAVQTIANNLIDGEPWSKGVVKAMIVGAVGGAVGGAGGVLLKGVGSVALRVAMEGGVNIIGGVAGEALGSVATGQAVNWTGALMGALVGAGIGAGLGIAGAIRGRIRVGGIGEPAAPPPPRPTIEAPPPAPAGRIRSALEATKILAPRPASVLPEVNVGAGAAGEVPAQTRPSVETPQAPAAPEPVPGQPRRAMGFGRENEVIAPKPEPVPGQPRRAIGLGRENEVIPPKPEPVPGQPRRAIGFGRENEVIAPKPEPAPGQPRRAIGFGRENEVIAPKPEPVPGQPRRAIGFGRENEVIAPKPEPAPGQPRRAIGIGRENEFIAPKPEPTSGASGTSSTAPNEPSLAQPRPMLHEPSPSSAGETGGPEPIRAGGRSKFEPRAVLEPGGGTKPQGGGSTIAEPAPAKPLEPAGTSSGEKPGAAVSETTPVKAKPSVQPTAEPAPASVERPQPVLTESAPPQATPKPTSAAEPVQPRPDSPEGGKPPGNRDGQAEFEDFQSWLRQEGSEGVELNIGQRRAQQIASGERNFALDNPGRVDVDEPLAVGEPNIKPQRAVRRALDPHNRQFLEAMTNQRTKHTRISAEDVLRNRSPRTLVTIDPAAPTGPGSPPLADPSVVFERRFSEIAELREIFDDAVSRVGNRNALSPTRLKARINDNIRDIIKNGRSPAGRVVRDALDSLGFGFTEVGLVARK